MTTHLDQLIDKLQEPRVRRVIEPVLSGDVAIADMRPDDLDYVRDLGLIAGDAPIRIANPIYRELIRRGEVRRSRDGLRSSVRTVRRSGRPG